ncbi:winged helix-turn-helix domain-containing protein [Enterovibrio makurazakiensis]|uniref:winged helix-turn-helix domain-containing protein n=1 Tax=Enterovibrio makurazakiensis TaxID=2910232 RepID=UPI003D1A96D7
MKTQYIHYAGVMTGDLVGSTEMSESTRQGCLATLESCFSQFRQHETGHQANNNSLIPDGAGSDASDRDTMGEIYRGDAFQLYTRSPEHLLNMALTIRIALKSLGEDARLSLAVAPTSERQLPVRMANNSDAFLLSGRHLDAMKNQRLAFSSNDEDFARDAHMVLSLLDDHITPLTTKMAFALSVWMRQPNAQHAELAKALGITRSAFTRIINRANYGRIDDTCKWYADRLKRYRNTGREA